MGTYKYGIATGLRNVYLAKVVSDDRTGTAYDTPFKFGDTITVNPTYKFSGTALDADNIRVREDTELVGIDLAINPTRIAPDVYAKIMGRRIDANGGIVTAVGDEAPEFALMYEQTLDNKKSKYSVIYKGTFSEPTENAETYKKGSVNYQTPTLNFSAGPREDGLLRYAVSEEMPGYSETVVAAWFTEVQEPADESAPEPTSAGVY